MSLYPFLLEPALHVKVWGGRRLESLMHKSLPTDEPYGEAWEVHDSSTIRNGPLAGRSLGEALKTHGAALVGPNFDPAEGFPLLAKLIDATDWLSVQVHPNDEQARELEGQPRGKSEAWYVLSAEPGAKLVIGVQPGTGRAEVAHAIRNNALNDLLVYTEVLTGNALYMPAGTIHALGPGLLIYEIQQSSDTTYRLYDWGRMGLDGEPRPLHVEKSIAVANLETLPAIKHSADNPLPIVDIVQSPYFHTLLHQLNPRNGPRITLDTEGRCFHILTCIEGEATLEAGDTSLTLSVGQTVLIPASAGIYMLSGTARVLRSFSGS
jgi:mannose-6-phosphate isomerase